MQPCFTLNRKADLDLCQFGSSTDMHGLLTLLPPIWLGFGSVPSREGKWEVAPQMERVDWNLTHAFAFVLGAKAYFATGTLPVSVDGVSLAEDFSDAFYHYSPEDGFKNLGPFPAGKRGYAIGSVMNPGTDHEMLYFGFGQTRLPEATALRWGNDTNGNYTLGGQMTAYPRLADLWRWDGQGDWEQLPSCPGIGRTHPAFVTVPGKVYAGAGFGELCAQSNWENCGTDTAGKSDNLRDMWVFEVDNMNWSSISPLPQRRHHPFAFSPDNHAYVFGGHDRQAVYKSLSRYNVSTNTWTQLASLPGQGQGRVAGTQFSHKGLAYVLGGEAASLTRGTPDVNGVGDGIRLLNLSNGTLDEHRGMPTGEFWRYNPAGDAWQKLPPMPDFQSRWAMSSFVLEDYVYGMFGVFRFGDDARPPPETWVWPTNGYRYYLGAAADKKKSSPNKKHKSRA